MSDNDWFDTITVRWKDFIPDQLKIFELDDLTVSEQIND
jgi:hypothetical protein